MNREIIIKELKSYKQGFTVSELASKLKVSRHTISNIFAFLEGARKVSIRKAGMAKIYYWKGK
jgi:DNA-binding transcriptional regulator YhcF (GntR family)